MPTQRIFAHLTVALMAVSSPEAALAQDCSYGTDAALSIRLNPPPGKQLMQTPFRTSLKVGGGSLHGVQIDTGSSAILLPKTVIGQDSVLLSAKQRYGYVSSGNTYLGDWMLAKVEVALDQGHGGPATAMSRGRIPVYGVTHTCKGEPVAPDYANCTPLTTAQSNRIGMMGIGYRPTQVPVSNAGEDASKLPSTNLFMNLGQSTPGYIITANSIQVGLNQTNTQGFKTLPMVKSAQGTLSPRTCIQYKAENGMTQPFCGATLLVDTGINHFYLTMPDKYCPANSVNGRAPDNASFTLSAPDQQNPVLSFNFKLDGKASSPMRPGSVNCVTEPGSSSATPSPDSFHVNTGRMVIAGMDYLYRASDDPSCHVIGFRPSTAK